MASNRPQSTQPASVVALARIVPAIAKAVTRGPALTEGSSAQPGPDVAAGVLTLPLTSTLRRWEAALREVVTEPAHDHEHAKRLARADAGGMRALRNVLERIAEDGVSQKNLGVLKDCARPAAQWLRVYTATVDSQMTIELARDCYYRISDCPTGLERNTAGALLESPEFSASAQNEREARAMDLTAQVHAHSIAESLDFLARALSEDTLNYSRISTALVCVQTDLVQAMGPTWGRQLQRQKAIFEPSVASIWGSQKALEGNEAVLLGSDQPFEAALASCLNSPTLTTALV